MCGTARDANYGRRSTGSARILLQYILWIPICRGSCHGSSCQEVLPRPRHPVQRSRAQILQRDPTERSNPYTLPEILSRMLFTDLEQNTCRGPETLQRSYKVPSTGPVQTLPQRSFPGIYRNCCYCFFSILHVTSPVACLRHRSLFYLHTSPNAAWGLLPRKTRPFRGDSLLRQPTMSLCMSI